jgi:hypothetical protein
MLPGSCEPSKLYYRHGPVSQAHGPCLSSAVLRFMNRHMQRTTASPPPICVRCTQPDWMYPKALLSVMGHLAASAGARAGCACRYMQARDAAVAAPKAAAHSTSEPRLTVDIAQQRIEESFQAAQERPVHPAKPHLTATEVMPVLPNTDCWGHSYVTVSSTGAMLTMLDALDTSEADREELLSRSLLKSYNLRAPPLRSCQLELKVALLRSSHRCAAFVGMLHIHTAPITFSDFLPYLGCSQVRVLNGVSHTT